MVERVNGTIKNGTIKSNEYQNYEELEVDLNKFLIYYNFNRRIHNTEKFNLDEESLFLEFKSKLLNA